jgi:hypothetical protein
MHHLLLCGSPPLLMITSFFISVFYRVATEGPTNHRSTVSRSRTVNLGTGPRGLPANARTSSSVNEDDNSRITRHRGNGDGTGGENAADNDASTINSSSSSLARAAAAAGTPRPMEQG